VRFCLPSRFTVDDREKSAGRKFAVDVWRADRSGSRKFRPEKHPWPCESCNSESSLKTKSRKRGIKNGESLTSQENKDFRFFDEIRTLVKECTDVIKKKTQNDVVQVRKRLPRLNANAVTSTIGATKKSSCAFLDVAVCTPQGLTQRCDHYGFTRANRCSRQTCRYGCGTQNGTPARISRSACNVVRLAPEPLQRPTA
jgi:hypothetical protein